MQNGTRSWLNPRHSRCAPDDGGGGGGGGEAPAPQQNEQPAPQNNEQPKPSPLEQKIDALFTRMEQQGQVIAQLAQGQGQRREEPEQREEPGYVDPEVKAAREEARQARAQAYRVADAQDRQMFISEVTSRGLSDEQAKYGLQVYDHWVKQKITFGGQPPSRVDALRYALGAMQTNNPQQNQQRQQEDQRQQENQHAFVERGGSIGPGQYRADLPADFSQKPLKEQAKVIGTNLDKAFPNGW